MPKKVYELAKELGVASKDLLDRAAKMGIDAKSHMSVLSDTDVKRLSAKPGRTAAGLKPAPGQMPGRKGPMGRPIVNDSYFENKKKGPAGKPIVDNDFLARREKAKAEQTEAGEVPEKAKDAEEVKAESVEKTAPEKAVSAKKPAARPASEQETGSKAEPAVKQQAVKAEPAGTEPKKAEADKNAVSAEAQEKSPKKTTEKKEAKSEKKPEPKKEPEVPKKNLDAEIKVPKIKIIKRASEEDNQPKQEKKHGQKPERKQGQKPVGRKPKGRPGQRPQGEDENAPKPSNRRPQHHVQDAQQGSSRPDAKHGGRKPADKRHGKHEGGYDKFDKFERKSLERQERKKYTKEKHVEEEEEEILPEGTFKISVPITVAGFAEQTEISISKVIMTLMKLGTMATQNQNIDEDTLAVLAGELGIEVVIDNNEVKLKMRMKIKRKK